MRPLSITALALTALLGTISVAQSPLVEVEGPVTNWNRTAKTFRATDDGRTYTIRSTARTIYLADEGDRLTAAQFWTANRNGRKVKVTGTRRSTTITATRIELDD